MTFSLSATLQNLATRVRDLANGDPESGSLEHHDIANQLGNLVLFLENHQHGWEAVQSLEEIRVRRLRVPGGWLYALCDSETSPALQFVPDRGEGELRVGDTIIASGIVGDLRVIRSTTSGVHMATGDGRELTLVIKKFAP